MSQDTSALMDTLDALLMEVVTRLPTVFPWAASLSAPERREFAVGLLQVVQSRDVPQLTELLADWQATAEALNNPSFMQAYQQPDDPDADIPWEQMCGQLNLSRDPEAGRP